jgi:outer membrane protein
MNKSSNLPLSFTRYSAALQVLCLALSIGVFVMFSARQQRVGYVNSMELVNGYMGMKEARNLYQNKSQSWQSNLDTLKLDFQKAVSRYHNDQPGLSAAERRTREEALQKMQANLVQYSSGIQENARQEDEKITQGVLNQINSFVQQYGKEKGYTVILGTTLSGSLLYGEEKADITKEVLQALNQSYHPAAVEQLVSATQPEAAK